jgi:hypothetical protein
VLAAVAEGNTTRGGIANYVGRQATDVAHPLTVLTDSGLLRREADVFRSNRSSFRIAEPLISFYHAVMRPLWSQLERPGTADRIWRATLPRYVSNVLGPHFEQLCREWAGNADALPYRDFPARVGSGTVYDSAQRVGHEVDVAVFGLGSPSSRTPLLAVGEAKWGQIMGTAHLQRLRRVVEIVERSGRYDTSDVVLTCFSGTGFTADLVAEAAAHPGRVALVGAGDLYRS